LIISQFWLYLFVFLFFFKKKKKKKKKVDYDVAAVSVGLTTRIVELITSSASVIPAQSILWQDSGRLALHAAGMEMAKTVFTSYK
jgi:hypothetical protein